MKIRTIIVDDEALAREGLGLLLSADPEVELIGQYADGAAAQDAIRRDRPDMVFLDIQMPKLDGFQVLKGIPPDERPIVVFVTAYDQYAIGAFEAAAIDYLLKPFSDHRFRQALARAKADLQKTRALHLDRRFDELLARVADLQPRESAPATSAPAEDADRMVVKSEGDLHFIKTRDIVWIEAQGDFVKVQTTNQSQLVRETLQSMEQKLDASRFLRIHRSFLVNVDHIKRVAPTAGGEYTVHLSDGAKLKLGRNYRSALKALLAS